MEAEEAEEADWKVDSELDRSPEEPPDWRKDAAPNLPLRNLSVDPIPADSIHSAAAASSSFSISGPSNARRRLCSLIADPPLFHC